MSVPPQTAQLLRILLVEDVPADAELAERTLRQDGLQFTALRVETETEFIAALDGFRPDLIISDYTLPTFNGLHALRIALARDASQPFIILTGSLNEETAAACIKAGATDYVLKHHLMRLPFAVHEALERQQAHVAQLAAEQALRESEAKFRSYIENAPIGIFIADGQGRYIEVNPAGLDLLGYDAATLLSMHITDIVPEEDHPLIFRAVKALRDVGQFADELRQRTRSGQLIWVSLRAVRLTDNRYMGFCQDITERKRLEHELESQRDFAMQVMNTLGQGLTVTDASERLEYVNPAFARLLGFPPAELLGTRLSALAVAEDCATLVHAHFECLLGQVTSCEARLNRSDGETVTVLVTAAPRWNDEQVTGVITLLTDLTRQKRVESQLKYLSTHDPLTGLYNRAFFETELERLDRGREFPVSLIVGDVDDLKTTNDTFGHPAGDDLLRRTAQILQSVFRASDVVARIGGDEFASILPLTDATMAASILARIREKLARLNAAETAQLNLSLGVATAECSPMVEAFKVADARMYQEKRSHKLQSKLDITPLSLETDYERSQFS